MMKPDIGKVIENSPPRRQNKNGEKCVFSAVCSWIIHDLILNRLSSDYTGIPVQQHQLSKFYEIYQNSMALLPPITILSELLKDVKVEGRKLALFPVLKVVSSQLEGFGWSGWHLCGVPSTTSVHLNHSVTCLFCHGRRWKHEWRWESVLKLLEGHLTTNKTP